MEITFLRLATILDLSVEELSAHVPEELADFQAADIVPEDLAWTVIVRLAGDRIDAVVDAGAAALDAHLPAWRNRVTRPIQMMSWRDCVLGQVFGTYSRGVTALGLGSVSGVSSVADAFSPDFVELAFVLEASWHRHLTPVSTVR